MSTTLSIVIIALCVLGEGFFSGAEIGLISMDKLQLRHAAKRGQHSARLILEMLKKPEWILGTTLLGTNVFVITSTTLAAALFHGWLGTIGIPVSIAVMAFVNWIFAEIVPKSIFQQLSNTITPRIAFIVRGFSILTYPVVWLFSQMASLLASMLGGKPPSPDIRFISKEELKLLMQMTGERSDVKPSEKKMINRLLSFTETEVQNIMVPLIEVEAVSDQITVGQAIEKFVQTKHRRLPVYVERVDRIVGVLNSFDTLAEDPQKKIKSLVRSTYFVPPSMSVAVLLEQLQNNRRNMAVVVDEFGGAEGIVTVEDILEEVVGEIEDEYDKVQPLYRKLDNGGIVVNGRMEIDEFNERFGLEIPDGDYETVGGFVVHSLKHIPRTGELVQLQNGTITVKKATRRTVNELLLQFKNKE